MELKQWLRMLPADEQAAFFMKASRFFSNRELSDIMNAVRNGASLYSAHARAGVLDRYSVDLNNLRG